MSLRTIEHFRRLAPQVQRDLAERFGLLRPEDGDRTDIANQWLLRSRENGTLYALGEAVQLAPQ